MEQDYYEILGVSRDADAATIRSAFKRLALTHHPDKVAADQRLDAEMRFKAISEAYETLSNEELRIIYDAEAEFGNPFGANPGAPDWQDFYYADTGDMPNFFGSDAGMGPSPENAFGNGANFRFSGANFGSARAKRTPDVEFAVELSLEDIFFGRILKLKNKRQVLCRRCQGTGGRPKAVKHRCQICKGFGTIKKTQMVGVGLFSMVTVPCEVCQGAGEIFWDRDLCRRCKGQQTQTLSTMVEVYVPKGVKNRHRIVVEGQADEEVNKMPGDLVIVVEVNDQHPVFKREGADLYAQAEISLKEALQGVSRPLITHLDGRQLQPVISDSQIMSPQTIIRLPGEGLPIELNNQTETGDLYLQIKVNFPTKLPPYIADKIARLLSAIPEDNNDLEHSDDTLNPNLDDFAPACDGNHEFNHDFANANSVTEIDSEFLTVSDLPEYPIDANDELDNDFASNQLPKTHNPRANSSSWGCSVM